MYVCMYVCLYCTLASSSNMCVCIYAYYATLGLTSRHSILISARSASAATILFFLPLRSFEPSFLPSFLLAGLALLCPCHRSVSGFKPSGRDIGSFENNYIYYSRTTTTTDCGTAGHYNHSKTLHYTTMHSNLRSVCMYTVYPLYRTIQQLSYTCRTSSGPRPRSSWE